MPDTMMRTPWRLRTAEDPDDIDFEFDVQGASQAWARPEDGRMAQAPCGGPPIMYTAPQSLQPRHFRAQVRFHAGVNRNERIATFEELYAARGPYRLRAPVVAPTELLVIFDRTGGNTIAWESARGARLATVSFQEVGTVGS